MTTDEVVRRLRAFGKGKPLPNGETLRVPLMGLLDNQIVILAFVKMGGESAPWGVAWGRPAHRPEFMCVTEPRTRDDVADMMARFAPSLLTHVNAPQYSRFGPDPEAKLPPFQFWLPNDSHLEMLHHLAYAYTFARRGEPDRVLRLQALGRACGWLFRESQRPGQTIVISAARALAEAYTFPSETTRQGHLGFLLAWLESKGSRDVRMRAASEAEQQSVSTALDPSFERDELEPYVDFFNEGRKTQDEIKISRGRKRVEKLLEAELTRRFELTERAITVLRADKRRENKALPKLWQLSLEEHRLQYRRMEQQRYDAQDGPAFTTSPETDRHPAAAGSRYYIHEASQEFLDRQLVHDDCELQAQLVAAGEAIAGKIVDVQDEGEGRRKVPVWTIESDGELPLRLREDSELCVVGLPSRTLRIRAIEKIDGQRYRFELQVTGLLTVPRDNSAHVLPATSPALKRKRVVLVKQSMDQIARRKSAMIWKRDVVGAWLTHAVPKVLGSELPREVAENLKDIEKLR
jgi:hypothetical protein